MNKYLLSLLCLSSFYIQAEKLEYAVDVDSYNNTVLENTLIYIEKENENELKKNKNDDLKNSKNIIDKEIRKLDTAL